jgi:hypothetical protein
MKNNLLISGIITLIFFIIQFVIKCKYENADKLDKPLKSVIKDSIITFSSAYVGFMIYDKFFTQVVNVTPVFIEKPNF